MDFNNAAALGNDLLNIQEGVLEGLRNSNNFEFADHDYNNGNSDGAQYIMPDFSLSNFANGSSNFSGFSFGDMNMTHERAFNCTEQRDFNREIEMFFSPSQIIVPVIYCIICLIGLIGNGLVMFVIIGSKEMTKSVANIYILNLAVADTLFLVSLPFSSTQRVLLAWPFGVGMCKIVEAVKYLNYFASIFFLTAMSIDRYFAVVYVVTSSRYRTNRNTSFVCLFVWLLSFVMVLPLLIYTRLHGGMCALVFNSLDPFENAYDSMDYPYLDVPCEYFYSSEYINGHPSNREMTGGNSNADIGSADYDNIDPMSFNDFTVICKHPNSRTFHVFIIFTFIIGFVVPFTVITVCYAMIVVRLLQPSETRSRSRQADRTRRKVTRMVVALVIVFFVCWLPFYVWHLVQIKGIHVSFNICHNVRDFTFCLCFANSCLNPILYTFLGHNFQERLRKSIAMSLRSFSFSTFTRYTTNTLSRADTGILSKKMEATYSEPAIESVSRIAHPLTQVPEEEPCISQDRDANGNLSKV